MLHLDYLGIVNDLFRLAWAITSPLSQRSAAVTMRISTP
jgi:hypothetical protein